jgi:hypothetical protein
MASAIAKTTPMPAATHQRRRARLILRRRCRPPESIRRPDREGRCSKEATDRSAAGGAGLSLRMNSRATRGRRGRSVQLFGVGPLPESSAFRRARNAFMQAPYSCTDVFSVTSTWRLVQPSERHSQASRPIAANRGSEGCGSNRTCTSITAGTREASARSSAGPISSASLTSSPWQPNARAISA